MVAAPAGVLPSTRRRPSGGIISHATSSPSARLCVSSSAVAVRTRGRDAYHLAREHARQRARGARGVRAAALHDGARQVRRAVAEKPRRCPRPLGRDAQRVVEERRLVILVLVVVERHAPTSNALGERSGREEGAAAAAAAAAAATTPT